VRVRLAGSILPRRRFLGEGQPHAAIGRATRGASEGQSCTRARRPRCAKCRRLWWAAVGRASIGGTRGTRPRKYKAVAGKMRVPLEPSRYQKKAHLVIARSSRNSLAAIRIKLVADFRALTPSIQALETTRPRSGHSVLGRGLMSVTKREDAKP
jgi:hypothetical protein